MTSRELKKNYLHRVFEVALSNKEYSNIIIEASFSLNDVRDIIEELKDEFDIKEIIYMDFDKDKIKSFYENNPSDKEIDEFVPNPPRLIGNTKRICFLNSTTDYSGEVLYEDYTYNYFHHFIYRNKEFAKVYKNNNPEDVLYTILPNQKWAESIITTDNKLDELWQRISKIILAPFDKDELENRIRRMKELNSMNIRWLTFNTNLGTDFRIELNPTSRWVTCRDISSGVANYPSYEIYTSPNCYSAEGKIIMSKSTFYDGVVKNAEFEFQKGRLVDCITENEYFKEAILDRDFNLDRIGEIALVPNSSPLAITKEFYNNSLLDENTGCHFALGCAIDECINVDRDRLEKYGYKRFKFNKASEHIDLVFGNKSVSVEAETYRRNKILLMDKGEWKI